MKIRLLAKMPALVQPGSYILPGVPRSERPSVSLALLRRRGALPSLLLLVRRTSASPEPALLAVPAVPSCSSGPTVPARSPGAMAPRRRTMSPIAPTTGQPARRKGTNGTTGRLTIMEQVFGPGAGKTRERQREAERGRERGKE